MHHTPDQECPVSPMPDTTDKESHEDIPIILDFAATVATQGNVDVLREPSSKRNMPPLPKILQRTCRVQNKALILQRENLNVSNNYGRHQETSRSEL